MEGEVLTGRYWYRDIAHLQGPEYKGVLTIVPAEAPTGFETDYGWPLDYQLYTTVKSANALYKLGWTPEDLGDFFYQMGMAFLDRFSEKGQPMNPERITIKGLLSTQGQGPMFSRNFVLTGTYFADPVSFPKTPCAFFVAGIVHKMEQSRFKRLMDAQYNDGIVEFK